MIVLGINDGHNASAALIINGKLTCAIAEERLSRKKNHFGYPEQSIKCVLDYSGVTIKDVNKIALSSKHLCLHIIMFQKLRNNYSRLLEGTK